MVLRKQFRDLRTEENERRYMEALPHRTASGCPLCRMEPLRSFTYWKIVENEFPYDRLAQRHDMLLPIRHTEEGGLNEEERLELLRIKGAELDEYEFILEPPPKGKSIPGHFHLHLVILKQE